jgi:hypothetical protein
MVYVGPAPEAEGGTFVEYLRRCEEMHEEVREVAVLGVNAIVCFASRGPACLCVAHGAQVPALQVRAHVCQEFVIHLWFGSHSVAYRAPEAPSVTQKRIPLLWTGAPHPLGQGATCPNVPAQDHHPRAPVQSAKFHRPSGDAGVLCY